MNENIEILGLGIPYEEWTVGRKLKTIGRSITEADITNFVNATGMVEVIFTNLEYLENESLLKGRPAPGIMVYAIAEGLLMQHAIQHTGLAFLGSEISVKRPCVAGDTIHLLVEVTEARLTSQPGRGIVTTKNQIVNQRGELVIEYTVTRMVKCASANAGVAS